MKCETCDKDNIDGARFCAGCGTLLPVEKSSTDPLIGQVVGSRYRVTKVLGEGGMGVVYVGEQQMGSTVRKVAIKTLHPHLSKDPSVLARFHRECGTVAQLEHPNTIKFYDFGSTGEGTLYIAMEFVAGKPLSTIIEEGGALPAERVLKIMRQVCGALDEAHRQGIIHRDLKPENIILAERAGETDFVKVLDFGIAARSESADAQKEQKLTQQGMVLGTPPYMSPEQFTGKALDKRSDIYSLGVMAYEMLTARLPFDADTPWQWATQHMTAQPMPFEVAAPGKSLPPGLRHAILRALSKERTDRQDTAQQFFDELSQGSHVSIGATPAPVGTGTAAMPATPGDSGPMDVATARTAGMPAMPDALAAPAATYGTVAQATPSAMAATPMIAGPSSGGNKGLIMGLGLVGGALLIAMIVIGARQMGSDDESTPPLTLTDPTAPATTVAPTDPAATPPIDDTPPPVDTTPPPTIPTTRPTGTTRPGTGTNPPKPDAGTTPPTGTTTTPPTGGTGGTTTDPPKDPDKKDPPKDTCDTCIKAAEKGSYPSAAKNYATCTDPAKKGQCHLIVKNGAAGKIGTIAMNSGCDKAQPLANAVRGMGAGSPALDKKMKTAGCR